MGKVLNSIIYRGFNISFVRQKAILEGYCNLCGKKIEVGQDMHRILTNEQQFPSAIVHSECMNPHAPFDKNNPLVWTADQLSRSWKEAQQYKHWFEV